MVSEAARQHAKSLQTYVVIRGVKDGEIERAFARFEAAIRADQIKRDAKVADEAADHEGPFTEYFKGRDQGCHDAAAAIRQKGQRHGD